MARIEKENNNSHDRFIIIDNNTVYHFCASMKDLGKKWFAFSNMDIGAIEMLAKLERMKAFLKSLPKDFHVLTSGYESGFENFYQPGIIKLKHEPEKCYYEGEFQVADDGDEETFDAVVLMRVVRDE